jgi:uncharacterized repeat protein (TIGR01451 family)
MKSRRNVSLYAAVCAALTSLAITITASAQSFSPLYTFTGGSDGSDPESSLVLANNLLYGTAAQGGASGAGSIFSVGIDGTGFTNIYEFSGTDGSDPLAGLILSGTTLYGTTYNGGASGHGTLFSINTDGTGFATLYSFTNGVDGANPQGPLYLSGTTLYGTTFQGGAASYGTVFAFNLTTASLSVLHGFAYSDGGYPSGGLVLSGTTLYGTASEGGTFGDGTVFKVGTGGTGFATLANLNAANGGAAYPIAGLVLSGSTLYGTSYEGGSGFGSIFKISTSGTGLTNIYTFTGAGDGGYPYAGLTLLSNVLYGTAQGGGSGSYGTIFSVGTSGSGFSSLYSFTDGADGGYPDGGIIISNNILYGTSSGDAIADYGSIFKVALGVSSTAFQLNFALNKTIDISLNKGNEIDPAVAVNPHSSTNLYVVSVCSAITNGGFFATMTTNLTTWTTNIVAGGANTNGLIPAGSQPTVAWDANSNLFLAYVPTNNLGVAVIVSTNGGKTFVPFTNLVPNDATQYPRLAAGVAGAAAGNVWLVYKDYSLAGTPLVAQGLQTTNIGTNGIGAFSPAEIIPSSANGGFPDIAIGPSNNVMVAFQNNINSQAISQVSVSVNTNITLTNGFGAPVVATADAVGGLTYIPAEPAANGINAGVGLAWDENPTSLYYGRAYLTYCSAQPGRPSAINIEFRYSLNGGASWSSEAQVNDDTGNGYSHFFPRIAVDPATGSLALCWYDCRNDTGTGANQTFTITTSTATNNYTNVFDLDGKPNDDFMAYGTASLTGGAVFAPNIPLDNIWTQAALTKALPPPGAFTYVSEAAKANNPAGIGHHMGLAYESGNVYPIWADNSGFVAGNPDFPGMTNFDLYLGYSVVQTANLGIYITVSPTNPISAESITYSVVVTNYGPFAAAGIVVTNVLADNVTLVGQPIPAPNGSYTVSANGQVITFSYPSTTLPPNGSLTNTFVISETQSGYATNVASVVSSLPSPNPANEIVTNITLVGSEDLAVGITASPTNINIGGTVTYFLSVTNFGPAANGPVFVTNILTANMSQISNVVDPQGTYAVSNNTIIFSLGTLTNQGVVNLSYSAVALSTKSIVATNTAIVTSSDFDTNLSNNVSVAAVNILGEDLGVTIVPSETNANIGDTITYTLTVTNYGPSAGGVITLSNALSSNLGQINLVLLPPGFGNISRNVITFNMGMLAPGAGVEIIYTAVALSVNGPGSTNAISTVGVSSTDFDTNTVNNTATALVSINGEDLAVGLNGSTTSTAVGQVITYTESVTNLGLSTNGVINVTNILSPNLTFNSVIQAPGTVSQFGNDVVFQVGVLGIGQSASIVFTATPNAAGFATDTMQAGSSDFDTNLLNNVASFTTTVSPPLSPVTNLTVTPAGTSALVSWQTPYPSTGQVAYGLTTNLGSISSLSPLSTNHVVLLGGLQRDTNYYFNVLTWEQGMAYTNSGMFTTLDTVIMTTGDAFYTGSWLQGPPASPGIYSNYFNVASTAVFSPTATAMFSPNLPTPGFYNVATWYPQSSNFASNTLMYVTGATNAVIASVNQTINGGSWVPLATNVFYSNGISGNVTIYNQVGSTNYLVAANAMKWTYNSSQDVSSNGVPPLWWSSFYYGTNTAAAASNYAEYVFGTAPTDPADSPDFWVTFPSTNQVMVTFSPYVGGRNYVLQSSADFSQTQNWVTLTNQPSLSTDGNGYGVFMVNQTNATQTFFRLSASVVPQ